MVSLRSAIFLAVLVPVFLVIPIDAQPDNSSRAPFVLEFPEDYEARYTLPIVNLPAKNIGTFRIRVIEPFAQDITYGKVIVTLNGEGVVRGCTKRSDTEGFFLTCRDSKQVISGFNFVNGKNILEVQATSKKDKEFYASYLIQFGAANTTNDVAAATTNKAENFSGRKFAVLIGVSEYKYPDAGLRDLDFADDDARAMADFLKSPAGGKFADTDIRLLLNQDASINAVKSALEQIAKLARPEDMVVIFIAGHGAPDPVSPQNLYFLLNDTKVVDMKGTAFPMNELRLYLDTKLAAKRVLTLIDTCHSAGINQGSKELVSGRDLVRVGDENNISNFYLAKQLFKESGRAVLTSSDVNEVSQESAKWNNHGVFTWALLEGLRGKADFNRDNIVTTGEIFQYTRATVRSETKFQQNPIALPGSAINLSLSFSIKR